MKYSTEELADIRTSLTEASDVPDSTKTELASITDEQLASLRVALDPQPLKKSQAYARSLGRRFKEMIAVAVNFDEDIYRIHVQLNNLEKDESKHTRKIIGNAKRNWLRTVTWQLYNNAILPADGSITIDEPPFADPSERETPES